MSKQRTMIFIDEQNVTHAAEAHYGEPKQLDYVGLVDFLGEGYRVIRPYLFTSYHPNDKPEGFHHALKMEAGYRVTAKPTRERGDGRIEKGVDIELATELIAQGFNDSYEVAMIVSGDADYTRAIRYVQDQGKTVIGATFDETASGDLKQAVDEFIDLGDHSEHIRRD